MRPQHLEAMYQQYSIELNCFGNPKPSHRWTAEMTRPLLMLLLSLASLASGIVAYKLRAKFRQSVTKKCLIDNIHVL